MKKKKVESMLDSKVLEVEVDVDEVEVDKVQSPSTNGTSYIGEDALYHISEAPNGDWVVVVVIPFQDDKEFYFTCEMEAYNFILGWEHGREPRIA